VNISLVISFDGLAEKEMTVHGADSVQAIELAVQDMEQYLRRLSKKYDLFFDDGEPNFLKTKLDGRRTKEDPKGV
jgi:hypothetical protein